MNKFKKRKEEQQSGIEFEHLVKKKKKLAKDLSVGRPSQMECSSPDENSEPNGQCDVECRLKEESEDDDIISSKIVSSYKKQASKQNDRMRRKPKRPLKNRSQMVNQLESLVVDDELWVRVKSCCGIVYENSSIGALLVDVATLTPQFCSIHKAKAPIDAAAIIQKASVLKILPLKKQHTLGNRYIEPAEAQKNDDATLVSPQSQSKINGNKNVHLPSDYGKKSNKIIDVLSVTKFNDNSSDSGYDETLHDTAQLNHIAKAGNTRPVILSNGVKIHVQPQNLLLAANLAGVSQTAIQTTQVITC